MASKSNNNLEEQQSLPVVSALKTCARVAAAIAILVGGLGLLGWIFDIPVFKNARWGVATMKANAALAFLLSGVSLWLRRDAPSPRTRRVADICAFVVTLIGLLTLLQYAFPRDFGIDRLLFHSVADLPGTRYPGRMAPITAALFVAVGLALLFLDAEDRRGRRPAQYLSLLVGLFALAALIGYLFTRLAPGKEAPYFLRMWLTELTFVLLSVGLLCARPDRGIARIVTADAVGGDVARRLLPAALVVPPLLCILSYLGFAAKWYEAGLGLAILTTLNSAVLTILIWRTAGTLNRTDVQRRHAESERNELNAALHRRVTELETLLDVLPVAVGIAEDPQCLRIRVNPAFAKLLALLPDANASLSAPEKEAPTSFKVFRNGRELAPEELPMQVAAAQGVEVGDFDEAVVWSDGTILRLLGYAAPLLDERGAVRGSVGAFVDITARTQAEEALEQAHAFREKVMDSAVFAVIALDKEGRFTLVNRRMTEITGYATEELIGQPFTRLLPADGREVVVERLRATLQEGVPLYHAETQLIRKDGSPVTVAYGWSALFAEGKVVGMVGTGEDITERKRLEDQLFQARKLESIGRLAGGVAHDFNNLLTAILGYAELADLNLDEGHPVKDDLEQICKAADRAAALTNQLLAFARRQLIAPKIVNLNNLILNLNTMLQRLIGEHIELVMQTASTLHSVCVDPNQFEQILINLVVNARDAIPLEGGRITVETGNVILDAEYARQHEGITPGDYVMLAVSDTGSGIDEAVQLQIFEPFFTTKEKGRGTGLGLATVYGIVKQAGGHIWLYSELGEGTTFKVYLPRATEPAGAVVAPASSDAPSRGTETLLVVEDEISVRTLTTSALRGLGYRVLEAADGMTALSVAAEYANDIDLLVTDVVMPQMSGKELAERLQVAHPTLKVLFVSGYTENTIMHHGVLEPGIAFLPKPFTLSALSVKVREALKTG